MRKKEATKFIILDLIQAVIALITFVVNFVLSYMVRNTSREAIFIGIALIAFFFGSALIDIGDQRRIYSGKVNNLQIKL